MVHELWALTFVLVLLIMVGLCLGFAKAMSFEMGNLPFFQITQHLNKTSFLFITTASQVWLCGGRQTDLFLFGNSAIIIVLADKPLSLHSVFGEFLHHVGLSGAFSHPDALQKLSRPDIPLLSSDG